MTRENSEKEEISIITTGYPFRYRTDWMFGGQAWD